MSPPRILHTLHMYGVRSMRSIHIRPDLKRQSSRDGCGAGVTVFHHLKRLREALPAILVSTVFTG
jgi:hypothetical protein